MAYDVLIDYIIKEGEERRENILTEAREKAGTMLSDLAKRIEDLRERAIHQVKKEMDEYRVKELNRARHRGRGFISAAQGDIINEVYREVDSAFHSIIKGSAYPSIIERLIIEGLQGIRGKVTVAANSRDCQLVKELLKGMRVNTCEVISVTADDRITGGVEILSHDQSISIINTLRSRLDKVKKDMTPEIGKILFPDA